MKKLALFVLLSVSLNSFGQYKLEDFKPLYRLASAWEIKSEKGVLVEQWERINDSVMHSKSYRVSGKDTIPEETVELKFSRGKITFTPTVTNQNEGKPVDFKLISIDGTKFTFENKEHDFPQRIIYHIMEKNLHVTINGKTKDGFREIPFEFELKEL
jgi:hypothetical protein